MAFNVSQFRNQMVGDGARGNLFEVIFNGAPVPGLENLNFFAKSAQLPGSSVGTVVQNYFGREIKFAGNRNFADWTITIINDENFKFRNAFEQWMNFINSHEGNLRLFNPDQNSYTQDAQVFQYGKDGSVIKSYNFVGMFPVDVSTIDLNWGDNNSIEEFSVTFTYQYWTSNTTDQ